MTKQLLEEHDDKFSAANLDESGDPVAVAYARAFHAATQRVKAKRQQEDIPTVVVVQVPEVSRGDALKSTVSVEEPGAGSRGSQPHFLSKQDRRANKGVMATSGNRFSVVGQQRDAETKREAEKYKAAYGSSVGAPGLGSNGE